MFVIVGEPATRITLAPGWLHRVCIVVSEQSGSVAIVQCQRVTNAVWNVPVGFHPPRLDLDPVTAALVVNLAIQQQQRFDTRIISRHILSPVDIVGPFTGFRQRQGFPRRQSSPPISQIFGWSSTRVMNPESLARLWNSFEVRTIGFTSRPRRSCRG